MFPTVILILIQALMFCCEENVTSEESISKQRMTCRTESRVPLSYDQYKLKTCAKCYTYMPRSSFKVQFQYRNGILRDPLTNMTYEANPVNTSQEILDSFIEEPYIWNWKGCCIAAVECCHEMMKAPPVLTGLFCPRTWDGWQCWQDTPAGTTAKQPCAAHIYFQTNPPSCTKYAYKVCWSNGTWYQNEQLREWTNYSKCGRVEEHRRYLYFHISTYSVSIISMIPALVIFSVYKQLQVPRITMHKNLFLSLFLNGVVVVLFKSIVIVDELKRSNTYQTIMQRNGPGCKILFILTKYFRMTNYMWMFCEGFYLHKLIAAAFAEQKNLIMFYIIGWVLPIVPVGIYAILRKTMEDEKCWAFPVEHYEWIMNGPNMLSLLVNLFFLCNIIRVLVTKLRAAHSNEPSQYRKAVRATLVLVPLFGLQFFLVIYRPQNGPCGFLEAYTYFSHSLDGLQGFLVSLIFCYMNGEVLYLLRRTYQRHKLSQNFRGRPQASIMMNPVSVTQVSSMADSQASTHHGLHYRSKNGDKQREIYNSVTDGNNLSEDVASV